MVFKTEETTHREKFKTGARQLKWGGGRQFIGGADYGMGRDKIKKKENEDKKFWSPI